MFVLLETFVLVQQSVNDPKLGTIGLEGRQLKTYDMRIIIGNEHYRNSLRNNLNVPHCFRYSVLCQQSLLYLSRTLCIHICLYIFFYIPYNVYLLVTYYWYY